MSSPVLLLGCCLAVALSDIVPIKCCSESLLVILERHLCLRCVAGGQFMKYGRSGSPHVRMVYMTADCASIAWCEVKKGKSSKDSHIRICDITDIVLVSARA